VVEGGRRGVVDMIYVGGVALKPSVSRNSGASADSEQSERGSRFVIAKQPSYPRVNNSGLLTAVLISHHMCSHDFAIGTGVEGAVTCEL